MSKSNNCLLWLRRILDCLTWIMMIVTFVVSIFTMIVIFGIAWNDLLSPFIHFLALEICLAATLFLWGITSIISVYDRKSRKYGFFSIIFGGILVVFIGFGLY